MREEIENTTYAIETPKLDELIERIELFGWLEDKTLLLEALKEIRSFLSGVKSE